MPQLVLRLQPVGQRRTITLPGLTPADPSTATGAEHTALTRWSTAIAGAPEPCVVLDVDGRVRALSEAAGELLGTTTSATLDRALLDVVEPIDFYTGESPAEYADRIPPLIVLKTGGLQRGLLRVVRGDGSPLTLDAVATPLRDAAGTLVGSLTFFAAVTPG